MTEDTNDSNQLNFQIELLNDFITKRKIFDDFIIENRLKLFTCPGCGYPTNDLKGEYEICAICNWEDDGHDDNTKSVFDDFLVEHKIGGPNKISLAQNKIEIGRTLFGLVKKMNGKINHNPEQILEIIKNHKKKMKRMYKSIPMTADINHEGFTEAKNARLEILNELITTPK